MSGVDWAVALNTGFIMVGVVGIILSLIYISNIVSFKKK